MIQRPSVPFSVLLFGSAVSQTLAAGNAPQPTICTRACWGAAAPIGSISQMSALNRAIVHHTAGNEFSTTGYEASKANVRAIQNLHRNTNGWGDIGYHFLVDKFGYIFEGRAGSMTSLPRGAHDGTNTNSFGFNCMGYFHPNVNNVPTAAMMDSLYDVIAWRMPSAWRPYGSPGVYGPLGLNVGYVDAHRRVKATACPGDNIFNPYMGTNMNGGVIRDEINRRIIGVATSALLSIGSRGDFNGDGYDDILVFNRGTLGDAWVSLSNGSTFVGSSKWHDMFCHSDQVAHVGDINGDGKDDLIAFTRGADADVWVSLSTGSSFGPSAKWHDWFCKDVEIPAVGDVNGDGLDDLICFTRGSGGQVWVCLSTGSGFAGAYLWNSAFCYNQEIPAVGDVNGDGRDDIITFNRGTLGDVWVALSDGGAFVNTAKWHDWFCHTDQVATVGDVTGDGKADLVCYTRGADADVWVAVSNGSSFGASSVWNGLLCKDQEVGGLLDATGDGKLDAIAFVRGTSGDVWVGPSTGSAFAGSFLWHDNFGFGSDMPMPGLVMQ